MIRVIGVVGFIGSGKGTVADFLVKHHGFVKDSLAASLKDSVSCMFGWPRDLLEGDTKESRDFREKVDEFWSEKLKRPGFTPRLALQLMGTEAGRDVFGQDMWIASLEKRIIARGEPTVVADVRFPNEIDWIHSIGGKVIMVQRGDNPHWYHDAVVLNTGGLKTASIKEPPEHYSEWAWIGSKYDMLIRNDIGLNDLENTVATPSLMDALWKFNS